MEQYSCEVAGTMLLPVHKILQNLFQQLLYHFFICAFYLLTFVVNKLPIAIVYATWSGLGIFTIAILGYIFYKQTLAWQAILGMFLLVIGVAPGKYLYWKKLLILIKLLTSHQIILNTITNKHL